MKRRAKRKRTPVIPSRGAAPSPLPWSLVLGVAEGAKSGIVDADGQMVFECVSQLSDVDLANLELMIRQVNGARMASSTNGAASSSVGAVKMPATGFHGPASESSETGGLGGA